LAQVAAFVASVQQPPKQLPPWGRPEGCHEVSLVRPENAPSFDIFGHNRKRRSWHENASRHFDFGTAHDYRGGLYGPTSDRGSAGRAICELNGVCSAFEVILGGMTDAFSGSISQAYKRAGRYRGISDRVAGVRSGDFPPRPGPNGRSIAAGPISRLGVPYTNYPPWLRRLRTKPQGRLSPALAPRRQYAQPPVVSPPKARPLDPVGSIPVRRLALVDPGY